MSGLFRRLSSRRSAGPEGEKPQTAAEPGTTDAPAATPAEPGGHQSLLVDPAADTRVMPGDATPDDPAGGGRETGAGEQPTQRLAGSGGGEAGTPRDSGADAALTSGGHDEGATPHGEAATTSGTGGDQWATPGAGGDPAGTGRLGGDPASAGHPATASGGGDPASAGHPATPSGGDPASGAGHPATPSGGDDATGTTLHQPVGELGTPLLPAPPPEPAPMLPVADLPAGLDPDELAAAPPSSARRGRLRRRVAYLRAAREVLLRDIGGFVYELHRTAHDIEAPAHRRLRETKLTRLSRVDAELHQLEVQLDDIRRQVVVREPGVGGECPQCGELFGSAAHYCSNCGLPLTESARRQLARKPPPDPDPVIAPAPVIPAEPAAADQPTQEISPDDPDHPSAGTPDFQWPRRDSAASPSEAPTGEIPETGAEVPRDETAEGAGRDEPASDAGDDAPPASAGSDGETAATASADDVAASDEDAASRRSGDEAAGDEDAAVSSQSVGGAADDADAPAGSDSAGDVAGHADAAVSSGSADAAASSPSADAAVSSGSADDAASSPTADAAVSSGSADDAASSRTAGDEASAPSGSGATGDAAGGEAVSGDAGTPADDDAARPAASGDELLGRRTEAFEPSGHAEPGQAAERDEESSNGSVLRPAERRQ